MVQSSSTSRRAGGGGWEWGDGLVDLLGAICGSTAANDEGCLGSKTAEGGEEEGRKGGEIRGGGKKKKEEEARYSVSPAEKARVAMILGP